MAWCVWSSKKHVSCVTMLVRVLLTGAAADAKYVGSLGTVEWTKGSQLSQTSSSFIVVLYAVPFLKIFLLLIIPGGWHRAIEAAIEPSRPVEPSSH